MYTVQSVPIHFWGGVKKDQLVIPIIRSRINEQS